MGKNRKPYTEEELAEIASRYTVLYEFRKREPSVCEIIRRRGLFEKLCGSMKRSKMDYSDERLAEIAAKYDDLTSFRNCDYNAYSAIGKRGLVDELCRHMKRGRRKRVSDEELAEIASRYTALKDFKQKDYSTYSIIRSRGLYDKLCGHMELGSSKPRTKEELAKIASRYTVLNEFCEKEPNVYSAICRRGLLEELCAHMKREHKDHYTNEELAEIAKRYKTHKDFNKNDHSALITIRVRGLYDQLCGHLKFGHSRRRSDEQLAEIAAEYDNLQEFMKKEQGAYKSIRIRGLSDKLCGHMKRSGNLAMRKIYVFTFSDGYAYVGLTDNVERRYGEHLSGTKKDSAVTKHIKETGATFEFKELTDFLDKDVASKAECDYIKQYADKGWKMLNIASGGCIGGVSTFYTDKYIKGVIAKYKYYEDLRIEEHNLLSYLKRNKLFDRYCSHMKHKKRERVRWTLERAIEAAKECKNVTDLAIRYYQAKLILKEAGLLDKYFPKRR